MNKSIIFLDIDGVITNVRTGWYCWDIYAVNWLIWFARESNSKIVISSTWRNQHEKEFFSEILTKDLMHDDWKTPNIYEERLRGKEIKQWLDNHSEVKRYIIFDDDSDMLEEQIKFFVQTDTYNGLLFEHIQKAMNIFEIEKYYQHNEVIKHPIMFGENWFNQVYRKTKQKESHENNN